MSETTPQAIFDQVVAHLRQQGEPALTPSGHCVYRTDLGLKCAIGCLLTDEEYSPHMEGHTINSLCDSGFVERLLPHVKLLRRLQGVHDCHDVSEWELALQEVARHYELTYTPKENP